CMQGLEIPLTF
nr:immunoglobulin light chain junction region [Macaca mulatta]